MIQKHKKLVRGFFMNARSILRPSGEIHVNHKTNPPFDDWCINELGRQSFLWPIGCVEFKKEDYPGYNNKRGDGSRCDEPFPLGKCSTFKFATLTKKESNPRNQRILSNHHHYPLRSLSPHSPPEFSVISCRNGHLPIFGGGYLNSEIEILGGYVDGTSCELQRSLWPEPTLFRFPQTEHVRNMDMILGKQASGYAHGISGSELQRSSWPKSTEFIRYPRTEHSRNMDMIWERSVSECVHGTSSELQRRSWWPESSNVVHLGSERVRDEYYDSLRPYLPNWF